MFSVSLCIYPCFSFDFFFFFQAEDGIRDWSVTGVQTCALPIYRGAAAGARMDRARDLARDAPAPAAPPAAPRRLALSVGAPSAPGVIPGGAGARTTTHWLSLLSRPRGERQYAPILIGRPHDTARPTPRLRPPGCSYPPPPGARRPNSRFRAAAPPSRRLFFFPHFAAPSYNARYMRPFDSLTRHASSWGWLVTVSAFALLTAGLVMVLWWGATTEERTSTYVVRGTVNGITLDIGDADLDIVGGGTQSALQVSRTDRFSFGHPAEAQRTVRGGTLALRSRCPATLLGSCSSAYRLRVPDNVPITVRTSSGDVSSSGYRGSARVDTSSGSVNFNGWCGFNLQVRAATGNVRAVASCSPDRLQLRSRRGSIDALVPPGRYRVDAESDEGTRTVRGLTEADDAPFQIQALSTSGDVSV